MLLSGRQLRFAACAQHQRNVGTIDVGVKQSDLEAEARQGQRKIDGERGFADSALAGTDCDDGADTGNRLRPFGLRTA